MSAVDEDSEIDGDVSGIVTPVPEDPNVAVSVAYAFGVGEADEARDFDQSEDSRADEVDESESKQVGMDDLDQPTIKSPSVKMPAALTGDSGAKGKSRGKGSGIRRRPAEEEFDSRKTIRMQAIRLEDIGLSEDDVEEVEDQYGDEEDDVVDIDIEEDDLEQEPVQTSSGWSRWCLGLRRSRFLMKIWKSLSSRVTSLVGALGSRCRG